MDLIDISRAFHSKAVEYAFFPSAHGTFSRIDHPFRTQKCLNKFEKIEIISSIFSDHNAMKVEINLKNNEKQEKTWKLRNMLLNNEWVNNKIKEEIKDTLKQMKMGTQQSKIYGTQGKQPQERNS